MSNRIVTIHQSQFLPWMPYFSKMLKSDVFVVLDDVQFEKNGVQNRNQIKNSAGAHWITVPVKKNHGQAINEAVVADVKLQKKMLASIKQNYSKALNFDRIYSALELDRLPEFSNLHALNAFYFEKISVLLGYAGKIVYSSALSITSKKSDLVLDICKEFGADIYLSGSAGADYLLVDDFQESGIQICYQKNTFPEYPQLHPKQGFTPMLSILDFFFNVSETEWRSMVIGVDDFPGLLIDS